MDMFLGYSRRESWGECISLDIASKSMSEYSLEVPPSVVSSKKKELQSDFPLESYVLCNTESIFYDIVSKLYVDTSLLAVIRKCKIFVFSSTVRL